MAASSLRLEEALQEAFDFVSADEHGEHLAYVCRPTGEIFWSAPDLDLDEFPEDVDDSERYACVPDKRDLDLGKHLVLDFAAKEVPDLYDRIDRVFRSA